MATIDASNPRAQVERAQEHIRAALELLAPIPRSGKKRDAVSNLNAATSALVSARYHDDRQQMLTQVEWTEDDFETGERIARALGFEQFAYTSTSALWGLFCLPENPEYAKPGQATAGGCIIKTRELGFLFVQDGEDRHFGYDWKDA